MVEALPEGAKRDALKGDLKAGLVMRAFESAQVNGVTSPARLQKQLINLKGNRAFRDHLSSQGDIKAVDDLITNLGKYVDATTRRDVYSPSGPAVLRGLEAMLNSFAGVTSPLGGRMITEPIKSAVCLLYTSDAADD